MSDKLDAGLVGELLIGEIDEWYVGVCRVESDGYDLVVFGENDHRLCRCDTSEYRDPGTRRLDLRAVANELNGHIEYEHDQL